MVIGRLSGAFSGDAEGGARPPSLTPEAGAAGLMVEASQADGTYTEVERQAVTSALMKLFHLPGPKASALRAQAETLRAESTTAAGFAAVAAQLPPDDRDHLVRALWTLLPPGGPARPAEHHVLGTVSEAFELGQERLAALQPR